MITTTERGGGGRAWTWRFGSRAEQESTIMVLPGLFQFGMLLTIHHCWVPQEFHLRSTGRLQEVSGRYHEGFHDSWNGRILNAEKRRRGLGMDPIREDSEDRRHPRLVQSIKMFFTASGDIPSPGPVSGAAHAILMLGSSLDSSIISPDFPIIIFMLVLFRKTCPTLAHQTETQRRPA